MTDYNNDPVNIQIGFMKRGIAAQLNALKSFCCDWCDVFPSNIITVAGKSRNYKACTNCVGAKKVIGTEQQTGDTIIRAVLTVAMPILEEGEKKLKEWQFRNMSDEERANLVSLEDERKKRLDLISKDLV